MTSYPLSDTDLPNITSHCIPGPKSREWAQRLKSVESPDTTYLSDQFPLFWTRAKGCLVYDEDGNSFLDLTSSFGVLSVGHCHPRVVEAINRQSSLLIHGMGDVHPSTVKVQLLEKISEHSPIKDPLIILGTNGSDAVESALKTAYLATGKPGVIAFDGGYHGLSYGALEVTQRGFFRDPFEAQRGRFAHPLEFGCDLQHIEDALGGSLCGIGAIIVEPIQGRAGIRIPPEGWLVGLRKLCSKMNVLLIFDEIFTGWGRTGHWFECEREGVAPDLLCIGKGMGGGMPISACLGSTDLMRDTWAISAGEARHTYTFLGHPLSCASALATISVLEEEGLIDRSAVVGSYLLSSLIDLARRYPHLIKEVRGRGMMLAIELHDPKIVWPVVLDALSKGIILLPAGDLGQAIEIVPPLILTHRQATWCLSSLSVIFDKIS
jgi:4-aminobutyrate aminotransferase-like enzyme